MWADGRKQRSSCFVAQMAIPAVVHDETGRWDDLQALQHGETDEGVRVSDDRSQSLAAHRSSPLASAFATSPSQTSMLRVLTPFVVVRNRSLSTLHASGFL